MKNRFRDLNAKAKYHLEQLMEEIHQVAYNEGYEAGHAVGKQESIEGARPLTAIFDEMHEMPILTPNQQRADLIEKAKEFVENNTFYNGRAIAGVGVKLKGGFVCIPKFIVNHTKRTVVVLFSWVSNNRKIQARGIAKCMPGDVFNEWFGKAIALAKALEIDIPVEFLEAVQPVEVVVGQIVSRNFVSSDEILEVKTTEKISGGIIIQQSPRRAFYKRDGDRIIDDTNAKYQVTS